MVFLFQTNIRVRWSLLFSVTQTANVQSTHPHLCCLFVYWGFRARRQRGHFAPITPPHLAAPSTYTTPATTPGNEQLSTGSIPTTANGTHTKRHFSDRSGTGVADRRGREGGGRREGRGGEAQTTAVHRRASARPHTAACRHVRVTSQ